jgi:hypothetical protein
VTVAVHELLDFRAIFGREAWLCRLLRAPYADQQQHGCTQAHISQ